MADSRWSTSEEDTAHSDSPGASPLSMLADTNVVLDLLLERDPWYTQAKPMWEARDQGRLYVYLSASSLTDIYYICRKQVGVNRARACVEVCLTGFTIVPVDRLLLEQAFALPGNDFEDNVQIACARAAPVDFVVTHDVSDFAHASIPAVDPIGVIAHLGR